MKIICPECYGAGGDRGVTVQDVIDGVPVVTQTVCMECWRCYGTGQIDDDGSAPPEEKR